LTLGNRIAPLEGLLLLILGGFAAVFLFQTRDMGETAAWFPRVVAQASLALLGAALAVQWVGRRRARPRVPEAPAPPPPDAIPWGAALAAQAAYVLLIILLGFPLATLAYLVAGPLQMQYRRWPVLIPYAAVLTAAVVGSFLYLFNVRLPVGLVWSAMWPDR
jgi:hypothetical protein